MWDSRAKIQVPFREGLAVIQLWIELDSLNDAFGLVVSVQNERLLSLAVRGSGAAAVWPALD